MVQLAYSACQNRDNKPPPPQKKNHITHTKSTHPYVCALHVGGRETRNETMELAAGS